MWLRVCVSICIRVLVCLRVCVCVSSCLCVYLFDLRVVGYVCFVWLFVCVLACSYVCLPACVLL